MAGFKELNVWQLGKELAVSIYKITAVGAFIHSVLNNCA